MRFIEFIKQSNLTWFFLTVFVSFLPLVFRFLVWTDFSVEIFDIKDLLFAGLAINLANFNLANGKDFDQKINIVVVSVILSLLFAFLLGIMLLCEAYHARTHVLNWFSLMAAIVTVYLSYQANNYVFKSV